MPRKRVVSRSYSGLINTCVCIDVVGESLEEINVFSPDLEGKNLVNYCKKYIESISRKLKFCYIKESKAQSFYAVMDEPEFLAHSTITTN